MKGLTVKIFKYPIEAKDRQTVEIPYPAKILSVQLQNDQLCLWAMVDTERESVKRRIKIVGTGHPFGEGAGDWSFIGTVQMPFFVWHVFAENQGIGRRNGQTSNRP